MRDNFNFKDSEGKNLNVYKWYGNNETPKGIIQIAHGMAETALRYDYFCEEMVKSGYLVYAHDHRGHGLTSENKEGLGYIADDDGFNWMVRDVHEINNFIRKENPKLPIILFGHSMGSFISQKFAETYGDEIDGLILSGTNGKPMALAGVGIFISGLEIKLHGRKHISKRMDKLSFGNFNSKFKPNRTEFDWLCSVNEEVDKYIEDPFCGFVCTSSFYYDLLKGLKSIHEPQNLNNIPKKLPIFIFAGDKDPVGNCGKGIINLYEIYKTLNIKNVEYKLYEDGRHEMLNEKNKDEVIYDVKVWIDKNCN